MRHNKLRGLLYLDHPASGVFHRDRITVLNFLSAQATISLENAMLNQALEQKLEVQTAHSEMLTAILEATPDLIGLATPDREILYHNQRAADLLPQLSDPNNPSDFMDAHPPWAQEIIAEQAIPEAIEHGSWTGETALVTKDGTEIPVSQVLIAHKDSDGSLEAFSTVIRDITKSKAAEQALRESERKFASLAAAAPVAIYRMDAEKNCYYVNEHWSEQTGHPREAAMGHGWKDFVHPEDLEIFQESAAAFAADKDRVVAEPYAARRLLADGSSQWVLVHRAKELDDAGNITGYVGTLTDITQAKEAEERLTQLNDRLQRVLECGSIGAFEFSFADEKLIWDKQMLEIHGLEEKDFRGIHADWVDRLHRDDRERMLATQGKLDNTASTTSHDYRIVRPNGEVRHIHANAYVETDDQNRPIRIFGINMDVTDRREAEFAMRESESKFKLLVERVTDLIWSSDIDFSITYLSPQFQSMFGLDPADWIGKSCFDVVHPDDLEAVSAEGKRLTEKPDTPVTIEFRHLRHDGSYVWVLGSAITVFDEDGRALGHQGVLRDISVRKAAEVELQNAQAQMQRMTENVPGMIYRMVRRANGSEQLLYISPKVRELFEVEPEEALADLTKLRSRWHPDDISLIENSISKFCEQPDRYQDFDYRVILPKQGLRWRQAFGLASRTEAGDTIFDGIIIDITGRKNAELAMQNAQLQMKRIADNVPGLVFQYLLRSDGSHALTYVSSKCWELFEVEPEAAVADADNVFKRIHPDDAQSVMTAIQTSAETLQPYKEEFRVILPGKGLRWLRDVGQPARTDKGDTIWDGFVIDITDRKNAELALKESQDQFTRMTENVPGLIFRYVLPPDGKHRLSYIGPRCRELFEVEPRQAMKNPDLLFSRIHPDDAQRIQKATVEAFETLEQQKVEFRVLLPRRGVRWLESISQPSITKGGCKISDGVITDITVRRTAQLATKDAQARISTLTENSQYMMYEYVHGPDGERALTFVSSHCKQLFGVASEDVMVNSSLLFDLDHPEDAPRIKNAVNQAVEHLKSFREEYRVILPGHGIRWFQTIGIPTPQEDGSVILYGFTLDISEKKKAEVALREAIDHIDRISYGKPAFRAQQQD